MRLWPNLGYEEGKAAQEHAAEGAHNPTLLSRPHNRIYDRWTRDDNDTVMQRLSSK